MSDRAFEVETDQGIPVQLPSGATFLVLTESEKQYVEERVTRYLADNHFCVPSGTRVATQRGSVPIEEIRTGDLVWSLTEQGFALRPQRLAPAAPQPVLTIKTENRRLRCSPNHKILTWVTKRPDGRRIGNRGKLPNQYVHEWVKAEDLVRGLPVVQAVSFALGKGGKVEAPNGRRLDQDFMEFLGFFLGDGTRHTNDRVVRISKKVDANVTAHYVGLLRQVSGRHGYETTRYAEVSDRHLADELRSLGFWLPSVDRIVPEWVQGLSAELRRAFLRGYLDSDGTVTRSGRVAFQASNEELVHGIWGLCLSLGVAVGTIGKVRTSKHDAWRFSAGDPGSNKSIGTWDSRYQDYLSRAQPARARTFADRHGRFLPAPPGCEHSRVRSIEEGPSEPLWDLHVEGTHNFVADGVVVHNTNVSDFQDVDKMVYFELFMHRWSLWMSKGVDYYNDPVDGKVLAQQLNTYSTELRLLKKNLGIDKVARDRQRGDDCHDDQTEVLTEFGWQRFADVADGVRLATRSVSGELEYQLPTERQRYFYEGDLLVHESPRLSFAVTPKHRMLLLVNGRTTFRSAGSLVDSKNCNYRIPKLAVLGLKRAGTKMAFPAPDCSPIFDDGPNYRREWSALDDVLVAEQYPDCEPLDLCLALGRKWKDVSGRAALLGVCRAPGAPWARVLPSLPPVDTERFARWLGLWLSEGDIKGRRKGIGVSLSQKKPEGIAYIDKVMDDLGWPYRRRTNSNGEVRWTIFSRELRKWTEALGADMHSLRIPAQVFQTWTRFEMEALVEGLLWGDGTKSKGEFVCFSTTSPRLADDFQRLLIHTGYSGRIKRLYEAGRTTTVRGKPCTATTAGYSVSITKSATGTVRADNIQRVPYAGMIYCFTVPNGTLLTRRSAESAPIWSGNSVAAYIDSLRMRAKEFGIMRNQQSAKAIELFQQLKSLLIFHQNCDEVEQLENGATVEDLLRWIEEIAIPEFDAIDETFKKNQQSMWVRKQ